jgi:mono/diheme cytochrome c family protein
LRKVVRAKFIFPFLILFGAISICVPKSSGAAAVASPDQIEFFEKQVRPVLSDHCYSCHSAKAEKVKGGLLLDNPAAVLKGGDSGPVLISGDPAHSLLIKAVRYSDPDLQMPPKNKKLSDAQIAVLEAWVKMGAPMPAAAGAPSVTRLDEARAKHWAFQPARKSALPTVRNRRWIKSPVDNFILAGLEAKQIKPAMRADRRDLIRRVTYDLLGLPPTPREVEAFLADYRSDAYARLVERLLASPHYGERWGRYWLDVARYADSKGYLAGGEERRFPFSHTYRDYVVRAFNEDKPYDQFLIEQIAADKLSLGEDKRTLAALGFLTLGRRFLNNQNDIIDDRIDVVTRGTMGLTVACARCHDHKFDPISSKDYYALHGVFSSSEEPAEEPLLGALGNSKEYQDYLKEKEKIEKEIADFKTKEVNEFLEKLRDRTGDYLLAVHEQTNWEEGAAFETYVGQRKLNPAALRRWKADLDKRLANPDSIFQPWANAAKIVWSSDTNAAIAAKQLRELTTTNVVLSDALKSAAPKSLNEVAKVYTKLLNEVDAEWKTVRAEAVKKGKPAPAALASPDRESLRLVLYAEGAPANLTRADAEGMISKRLREGSAPLRGKIEALSWTHPGAPPRAMALVDRAAPANSPVFLRGNPGTPGDPVPRRFIELLGGGSPFTNGSGRLELARAIASPTNPLTARVYVNRIWLHHFGEGLVGSAGDFGIRTEQPSQHALLDYLASYLVEHRWSTKDLHRAILLSSTYQQSCEASAQAVRLDPDNRLYSRMTRQRLDYEAFRDTMLALSGKLDEHLGGVPVDIQSEPFSPRRSVYAFIDRQNLPGVFRTFDFANPDVSNQGRFHTTVPQQALFLMNSPFITEQARGLADRADVKQAANASEKIRTLYALVLQRPADPAEIALAEKFLKSQPADEKYTPLQRFAQVLLESNELMFLD